VPKTPSFGPTRDGRIKPDVVAISELIRGSPHSGGGGPVGGVYPAYDAFLCQCGLVFGLGATSFATPQVTGLVVLLAQANGGTIDPSLAKATICNTAKDVALGPPTPAPQGPDYKTGYGLVDGLAAHRSLSRGDYTFGVIDGGGQVDTYEVRLGERGKILSVTFAPPPPDAESPPGEPADGAEADDPAGGQGVKMPHQVDREPRFMIAWADPKCTHGCDDPNLSTGGALVNDLALRLMSPSGQTYEPWTLDPHRPEKAAKRTVNRRDPVEQVTLGFAEVDEGTWLLEVRGQTVPQGPQPYVLTWATRPIEPQPPITTTEEPR